MSQRANQNLLYGKVDPFLIKHDCAIIFIHHPPKVKDDKKTPYLHVYAAFGDATLSNWPRASFLIWPKPGEGRIFEFEPGKRANRLGWDGARCYKWSDEGIFWERASAEDVKRSDESEKGRKKVQLISAEALCEVFNESEGEWIRRGDLVNTLVAAGYTRITATRTIDPEDGYQRSNIEYRGEKKKMELRWIGHNGNFNPRWKQKSHPQ